LEFALKVLICLPLGLLMLPFVYLIIGFPMGLYFASREALRRNSLFMPLLRPIVYGFAVGYHKSFFVALLATLCLQFAITFIFFEVT
jgi:hypothetical protein